MRSGFGRLGSTGSVIILILLITGASPAFALPFFDFYGFSYSDGPPNSVGTNIAVPTRLNDIQPDPIWPLDFNLNEYTVMVEGLQVSAVEQSGPISTISYIGGTISLYRDSSKNSDWGQNPPNPTVPGTFTDGELQLVGHFTDMLMMYNSVAGVGTVSGTFTWTGGSLLGQISNPEGWTYFGGVSNHSNLGIPTGFDLAWDPQIYGSGPSVPVETSSWGRLKQLYR